MPRILFKAENQGSVQEQENYLGLMFTDGSDEGGNSDDVEDLLSVVITNMI